MNYEEYSEYKKNLIIVFKGEVKKDFSEKSKSVKSFKQLNFLLAGKDKKARDLRAELNEFSKKHEYRELIDLIQNEQPIPDKYQSLITSKINIITGIKASITTGVDDVEPLRRKRDMFQGMIDLIKSGKADELHYNCPWKKNMLYGHPENFKGEKYSGDTNVDNLYESQIDLNLTVPVFLSANDITELGISPQLLKPVATVTKKIDAYKLKFSFGESDLIYDKEYKSLSETDRNKYEKFSFVKKHPVYHADQFKYSHPDIYKKVYTENHYYIKHSEVFKDEKTAKKVFSKSALEYKEFLNIFLKLEGIKIQNDTICAYVREPDFIKMVPESEFKETGGYVGTLGHECIHATGHETRCNRQFGKKFGDDLYSKEEITAETGARELAFMFNLPPSYDLNSLLYGVSFYNTMTGTPAKKLQEAERACAKGIQAVSYIVDRVNSYKLELALTEQIPDIANFVKQKVEEQKPAKQKKKILQPS